MFFVILAAPWVGLDAGESLPDGLMLSQSGFEISAPALDFEVTA